MTGNLPAGLFSPARVRAMAVPPSTPGIPRGEDGGCVLVGPVQRDRGTRLQDDDQRLAGRGERLEQVLLRGWQIERGAIAAIEAADLDAHLLAFELWREPDECHDDVGLPGRAPRLRPAAPAPAPST